MCSHFLFNLERVLDQFLVELSNKALDFLVDLLVLVSSQEILILEYEQVRF